MKLSMIGLLLFCFFFLCANWSVRAGGFIVSDDVNVPLYSIDPIGHPIDPHYPVRQRPIIAYSLETRQENVVVTIDNNIATTEIEQSFYNPSYSRLEGHFYLPLPVGASIKDFSMWINGKEVAAELLDADKAKTIYQDIVAKLKDPALLEYKDSRLLTMKIFPIEPQSIQKIKIKYHSILPIENNIVEYHYTLGNKQNYPMPIGQFDLEIVAVNPNSFSNLYSPSHPLEYNRIKNANPSSSYIFSKKNYMPNGDFVLQINRSKTNEGFLLQQYKEPNEDGFFALHIEPVWKELASQVIPKDVSFVLDCSGSMSAEKMKQAKAALNFCIEHLNKTDRFNIIRFSTIAEQLFEELCPVETEFLTRAKSFIEGLKPIGGTNIEEALEMALAHNSKEADRPYHIVLITDGKPTIGQTDAMLLGKNFSQKNKGNIRVFSFGIGDDLNVQLLDHLTENSNGYRTYIGPDEDMEIKISSFVEKISNPVLTDIRLESSGVAISDYYPKKLPDLFASSSLLVLGRYRNDGDAVIRIKGSHQHKEYVFELPIKFTASSSKHETIASLWATRKVGYLLDQIRFNGEDQELVSEIATLARKYGIITPYTSYLIIEDEPIRNGPIPRPRPVPIHIPRAEEDQGYYKSNYKAMQSQEGKAGVQSSKQVNTMRHADNAQESSSQDYWMEGSPLSMPVHNYVQVIKGRAFYNNGEQWQDVNINERAGLKQVDILFGSKSYFELWDNNPQLKEILALGNQLQFVENDILYNIHP